MAFVGAILHTYFQYKLTIYLRRKCKARNAMSIVNQGPRSDGTTFFGGISASSSNHKNHDSMLQATSQVIKQRQLAYPQPSIAKLATLTDSEFLLQCIVDRSGRWLSLGGDICLGHATIDHHLVAVDKACLVAGQEQNSLSLLDGLAKAARREVDLTAHALGDVIAEPVLEKRSVERCGAQAVEAEAFTGVDNGELAGHGEDGALGGSVS